MDFQRFEKEVMERLAIKLGDGYRLESFTRDGINGTKKHSLLVIGPDTNIHPSIKMDECYMIYMLGKANIQQMVDEIESCCKDDRKATDIDISSFVEWEKVKKRIFCKLINTDKNRTLLNKVPHREFLDLSVVYYIHIGKMGVENDFITQIYSEHMELWGVCEDDLYREAWKNMRVIDRIKLIGLADVIKQADDWNATINVVEETDVPMYVLTDKDNLGGAAYMSDNNTLMQIAKYIGGDFWVLPSSTHEVILLPFDEFGCRAEVLAQMVSEINDTQVEPDEILSYHVYHYRRDTNELEIAA